MDIRRSCITIAILGLLCLTVLYSGCVSSSTVTDSTVGSTRTITDMSGRTLEIPVKIDRIISTVPMTTFVVYALAPEKLIGINMNPNKINGRVYMTDEFLSLPNIGGWFGKQTGNYEIFMSMNPNIIIAGEGIGDFATVLEEHQQVFGDIPVVGVLEARNSRSYDDAILFLGNLLGEEEKADELVEFYRRVVTTVTDRVSDLPEDELVRVYYAEGPKGLLTDPTGSFHSELIDVAGGINVADCAILPGVGQTSVSMEQVTRWNPDVIIAGDPTFYSAIFSDPLWQSIPAVRNQRVYLVPQSPYCWFDRPPGINRIIGIPWTARILYPQIFSDMDMTALTKEFYLKFYHYELSEDELNSLLVPSLR
jgi:iron complex transport system substrate-binding protein